MTNSIATLQGLVIGAVESWKDLLGTIEDVFSLSQQEYTKELMHYTAYGKRRNFH